MPNVYPDSSTNIVEGLTWKEADILCVRKSGYTSELEIKISKQDMRNDYSKNSHHLRRD